MKRTALIWDSSLLLARLLSDSGYQCDEITPHLLTAPFFRGEFSLMVIPGGFGNSKYSCVLPAVKALSSRFKRYTSLGGGVLLFGAVSERQDVYQWLVPGITYHFRFFVSEVIPFSSESASRPSSDSPFTPPPLLPVAYSLPNQDDDNSNVYSLDGYLICHETSSYPVQVLATVLHPDTHAEVPVFVRIPCENGVIFISTIHEYPTPAFLMRVMDTVQNTRF
jgi:hypothetical protein